MNARKIVTAGENIFLSESQYVITQERWEGIARYRRAFFACEMKTQKNISSPYMDPEVEASWLRSRQMGVDPYAEVRGKYLSLADYSEILERNCRIVKISRPLFQTFDGAALTFGWALCLMDNNGVVLLFKEKKPNQLHLCVPWCTADQDIDALGNVATQAWLQEIGTPGFTITDEKTVGTTAHSLCVHLKRPVQLLGPEHYNEDIALTNMVVSAAPIVDENGEDIYSLVFFQPLDERPWETQVQLSYIQTLCFVTALALSIESKLKLLQFSSTGVFLPVADKKTDLKAFWTMKDIVGESAAIAETKHRAAQIAASPENVLIVGESGTGKELFAQTIHHIRSPQGPFMAINCAAIPRTLIESELFGYESGSFTGAERGGRPGKIELAGGGTLFLDEIGDMPLDLQAVLLRVLEEKQVTRLGGRKAKKVDFRLIAATNRDLYTMVKVKTFREDLFFRLSVLILEIPPLRERVGDVDLLSRHFIRKYCEKMGWRIPKISPSTMEILCGHSWPGNVRQLENAMIFAANLAKSTTIEATDLPSYILADYVSAEHLSQNEEKVLRDEERRKIPLLEDVEKELVFEAYKFARYDVSLAAQMIGVSHSTMYRKLKKYKIKL